MGIVVFVRLHVVQTSTQILGETPEIVWYDKYKNCFASSRKPTVQRVVSYSTNIL